MLENKLREDLSYEDLKPREQRQEEFLGKIFSLLSIQRSRSRIPSLPPPKDKGLHSGSRAGRGFCAVRSLKLPT